MKTYMYALGVLAPVESRDSKIILAAPLGNFKRVSPPHSVAWTYFSALLRRYHEGATNLDLSPECLTSSLTAAETHIRRLRMPSSSHWDQDSTAGLVNVKIVLPFFYTHRTQNFSQFPSAPPLQPQRG